MTVLIGGLINSQLGKDLQRLCKDYLMTVLILGGGQLTVNLEGSCKDFARITSDSDDPWGVHQQSTWEGSMKTLQGLPQTVLILGGGSIDSQLWKDPQRLYKDYLRQC